MSFKAKTVLNKDVRVFKQDIDSMEQGLEAIKKFIQEKYEIKGAFTIQYEDEEKDLITIATSEDLEEAYDQAESNGSVLKLVIVPEDSSVPVYELTSELDKSQVNEQGVNTSSDSEEEDGNEEEKKENEKPCIGKELLHDLIHNKEFRQEFINFIINLITILKQDISNVTQEAYKQVLSKHENVAKHPALNKLNDILPTLLNQFIGAIDVENIGTWINSIIEMLSLLNFDGNHDMNSFMHGSGVFPMIFSQLLGFPFGHMPPPPPPPPHYGHFYHGYGGYSYPHPPPPPPHTHGHPWFGNFGAFVPPPPPFGDASPFGLNGFFNPCGDANTNSYGRCPRSKHGFGYGPRHGHGPRRCRRNPHAHPHPHPHGGNFQGFDGQSQSFQPPCHGFGPLGMLFDFPKSCGKGWKKHCKQMNKKENNEYSVEILNDSVTLADKAFVFPEEIIVKTWHVKNNGKKDWPQGMKLKYFGPTFNPIINGVEFNVPELKINEEADISVMIEIPKLEDSIKSKQKAKFRLCLPNDNGCIGPIFKVRICIINEEQDQVINDNNEEKKDQDHNVNDVIEKLKENKSHDSSPSSFADIYVPKIEELNIDEDDIHVQEDVQVQPVMESKPKEEKQPILESNIVINKKEEKPYIYENQLNVILSMGFDDVEKICGLLDASKGDINVVIGQLFA